MSDYDDQQLDAECEEQESELEAKEAEEPWPTSPDLTDVLPRDLIGKKENHENIY